MENNNTQNTQLKIHDMNRLSSVKIVFLLLESLKEVDIY